MLPIAFTVTGLAVKAYHTKLTQLARQWYKSGEVHLSSGRADKAINDFRTALVYSGDEDKYQLRLAQALIAAKRDDEAHAYLLNVWQDEPEDAMVNLELGRLAARHGKIEDVLRYYHQAIYGNWDSDPAKSRLTTQFELYRFLAQHDRRSEAQSELIAIAGDLPPDPALHSEVGNYFLEAKDYDRALREYRQALTLQPRNTAALRGSGRAYFAKGDYAAARSFLERALRRNRRDEESAKLLELANLVLATDPYEHRLSSAERSRRVFAAFGEAFARLENCALRRGDFANSMQPQNDFDTIYARAVSMRSQLSRKRLERDPDLANSVMDIVVEAENVTTSYCGPPKLLDRAILLAAARHAISQ
jgi:tetratricopeptide (TPR) repeat protein